MKIKCVGKNLSALSGVSKENYSKELKIDNSLTIGKKYNVYFIGLKSHSIYYHICCDDYQFLGYPTFKDWAFFEVIDDRIPNGWRLIDVKSTKLFNGDSGDVSGLLSGIDPHIYHSGFFERLTDGEPKAVEVWQEYKKSVDSFCED